MTKGPKGTSDSDHSTGEFDDATGPDVSVMDRDSGDVDGFDVLFGDENEEWPERTSSKGFRAPWLVTVLMALLLVVSGLGIGALLQRQQPASTTSASALGGLFGQNLAGATAAGSKASTGASTTSSQVTSGTVTDIIGTTLYVTNSSGALVAVKVSSATTIDRNAGSTLSSLKPGDTVTVQGPTAKNGSVSAASISATAKGVTSTGFGGGGGFAGRGGGTSASTSTGG
jgi:hypothetical protein